MMNFFTKLLTPVFIALGIVNPTPIVETPIPDTQAQQELIELRQKVQEFEAEKSPETETEITIEFEVQAPETKTVETKKEITIPASSVKIPQETIKDIAEGSVVKKMTTSEFNTFLASDSNLSRSYNKAQIIKPSLSCSVNYSSWDQTISPSEKIYEKKTELEEIIADNYRSNKGDKREYEDLIEWVTGVSTFSPGYTKELQDYVITNTPNPETHQFDFSNFNTNTECIKEAENIITILMEEKLNTIHSEVKKQEWINEEITKVQSRSIAQVYVNQEIQNIYDEAETMDFGITIRQAIDLEIERLNELVTLLER